MAEVSIAKEGRVSPFNAVRGAQRSPLSGISRRTMSFASNTGEPIDSAIINRATSILMNTFGTENSSVNAERVRRAMTNMRRRFGYSR